MLRRLDPVIGAVAVLALIVVAAGLGAPFRLVGGDVSDIDTPVYHPPAPPLPPEVPDPPADAGGFPWGNVVLAIVLLAVVALLLYTLRHAWRNRPHRREEFFEAEDVAVAADATPPGAVVNLPVLADAVEEALRRLDEVREPRDAVVAAWVELEEAAARHGWERDPAQTPTEFTAHLLAVSPAPPQHTATLRRLYQHARFAEHPVTPDRVAQARAALEAIARELETSRRKAAATAGPTGAAESATGPGVTS